MISAIDILNAKILIVDDQEANVALLEQLLREAGYGRVSSTMNPHEVFNLHRDHAYDLILLDLQMPLMDGFQVIEGLKTNESDDYLPVLVLTAHPGHKLRALELGVRDFISTPFDLVEVRTRIRNMLEVQLLYRQLERHNRLLEQTIQERTAELRESEARYRSLTELATDWYWEQDEAGSFTRVSGPVLEMLGIRVEAHAEPAGSEHVNGAHTNGDKDNGESANGESANGESANGAEPAGWNEEERSALRAKIAAREPFLDFVFSRTTEQGAIQRFQVSGQPMFDRSCRFIGYRGIGVEVTAVR
jgi:CheY-like chemotaxis protein